MSRTSAADAAPGRTAPASEPPGEPRRQRAHRRREDRRHDAEALRRAMLDVLERHRRPGRLRAAGPDAGRASSRDARLASARRETAGLKPRGERQQGIVRLLLAVIDLLEHWSGPGSEEEFEAAWRVWRHYRSRYQADARG